MFTSYVHTRLILFAKAFFKRGSRLLVAFFLLFAVSTSFSQTTIWLEDFPYSDGTTVGSGTPPKWTRDVSDCDLTRPYAHFEVSSNYMEGRNLDGEAVWTSELIDISDYTNVKISTDVSKAGTLEPDDYIRFYYKLNGGTETLFDVNGSIEDDFSATVASQSGLDGNNLEIVVRVRNNWKYERHRFDNMKVEGTIRGDDCAAAIPVNEVVDLPFSTNAPITVSGVNPSCGGGTNPYDIWYAYTPSGTGMATFDLCGSNYDTRLAIWDGCGGSQLACNDDDGPSCSGLQSSIEMEVTGGVTYYVQVGGYNANRGTGDLTISLIPYPSNDDCANAIAINEVDGLGYSTTNGHASGVRPSCGGSTNPIDIWYAYTATQTGSAVFSLCGSDYNTRLAIWSSCGGTELACNDDAYWCSYSTENSELTMNVTNGTTYYVQVAGYNAEKGDGSLTISVSTLGTNDACANAIVVTAPSETNYTTVGATSAGDRASCVNSGDADPIDIWFSYTPAATSVVNIGLCESHYDSQIAVWDACGGTDIACNDDEGPLCSDLGVKGASVQVSVTAGSTYYIQVFGWDGATGNGDLSLVLVPPPTNDDCANAAPIHEVTDTVFTTTVNATAGGDNPGCGGATDPVDIWYAYSPTESGLADFDLCGSSFDTRLAIWDACGGSVLACNDDDNYCGSGSTQSHISMQVYLGTTYYVQVGGKDGNVGTGDLTISLTPFPTNDDCVDAIAINEVTDLSFITSIGATAGGDNPGCGGGTNPVDIWYAYTPTATGKALFDLCGSSFDTRIALWDACGGTVLACNDDNGPGCSGSNASLEYNVSTSNTYYVQVGGRNGNTGEGDLTISFVNIPNGQWIGVVDSDWDTPGNWVNGVIPNSGIDTRIIDAPPNFPEVDEVADCKNLFVDVDDSVTINTGSVFSAYGDYTFNGVFIINDGTFGLTGDFINNGTFHHNGGTLIFNGTTQSVTGNSTTPNSFYSVTVASGSTTTLSNSGSTLSGVLKVDGTLNTGDDLTLKSTASQTALVDGSGTGTISGEINMERYLPSAFGYRYVSSPFTSATVNEFSPYVNLSATFPPMYAYDENDTASGWYNYSDPSYTLNPLYGYALNFGSGSSALTFEMTGTATDGSVGPLTLYNHDRIYTEGFNLIGNPYPSPIDWDAASGWAKTNIDDAVYYFNPSTTDQYGGTYSTYINGVSSDGTANSIIPSMQGFFVHVTDGAYPVTASLGINNDARVNNLSPTYHKKSEQVNSALLRLCVQYNDAEVYDPLVIYFNDSASAAFEKSRDALKLMNSDSQVPSFYAFSSDNRKLSIYSVSVPDDSLSIIPVGLSIDKDALVTFNACNVDLFDENVQILLHDKGNYLYHNLTLNPVYKIYLEAGDYTERFSIVFTMKDIRYQPGKNDLFYAYNYGNRVYVHVNAEVDTKTNVTLTNLLGQSLWNESFYGNGYHDFSVNVKQGIYILNVSSDEGYYTKKLFINNGY